MRIAQALNHAGQSFAKSNRLLNMRPEHRCKSMQGTDCTITMSKPVAAIREIAELNIGHAIIARAVFSGLYQAVKDMKTLMDEARR